MKKSQEITEKIAGLKGEQSGIIFKILNEEIRLKEALEKEKGQSYAEKYWHISPLKEAVDVEDYFEQRRDDVIKAFEMCMYNGGSFFDKTIYESHEKSAFQEWEDTMPGYRIYGSKTHFTTERKEGWNAAIDYMLNDCPYCYESINKLREKK